MVRSPRQVPVYFELSVLALGVLIAAGLGHGSASGDGGLVAAVARHGVPPPVPTGEPVALSHTHCADGFAGPYPCRDVDLLSFMPRSAVGAEGSLTLNDVWGWTDPQNGREYGLVGVADGLAFVDLGNAERPVYLGKLPTRTFATAWRGVKTYRNFAYVIADGAAGHGMQVFDLTRLRGAGSTPQTFRAEFEYFGAGLGVSQGEQLGSAHNVVINEETGFAYLVGSDTCNGGLHMVDLANPARPRFAGCFSDDGYTHDAQCVVYQGPDTRYRGREICFASNEDTVTIVDVTDKREPRMLSRTSYTGAAYAHQTWLTEDHAHFLLDDEFDEIDLESNTRTYVWSAADLERPRLVGTNVAATTSTDHNLFIRGGHAFQANYSSGLRVLSLANVGRGELAEVAYFDVVPADDEPGFVGAWGNYPFFASGIVLVSGIQQGLFILRPFPPGHHESATAVAPPRKLTLSRKGRDVTLAWRSPRGKVDGFRVERSQNGGPYEVVAELGAAARSFSDRRLPRGASFRWRVVSTRNQSLSAPAEAGF